MGEQSTIMSPIVLPARCDRTAIAALLPQLIDAQGGEPVAIDARGVEQAGQALLQLLVSARRTASGATITPSAALAEAARLTGLSEELFGEMQNPAIRVNGAGQ